MSDSQHPHLLSRMAHETIVKVENTKQLLLEDIKPGIWRIGRSIFPLLEVYSQVLWSREARATTNTVRTGVVPASVVVIGPCIVNFRH